MEEAYYEEMMPIINGERLPFHVFKSNSSATKFIIKPHWHYYVELLYFIKGSAEIIIGNNRYTALPGDFIIINSREVHSICSEKYADTSYIVIKFDLDIIYHSAKSIFEAKYVLPFTLSQSEYKKHFTKSEFLETPIKDLPLDIFKEYTDKSYGYEIAVKINIGRIFLWIIRTWEKSGLKINFEASSVGIEVDKLQSLLDYLDSHYNDKLTVSEMAKMCNVSYCYFSRFFKTIMNKSFTEYLNYIRIIEAKRLLLTTNMNITEVALRVGYTSSSYFIEQFTRQVHQSPKQYQKRLP